LKKSALAVLALGALLAVGSAQAQSYLGIAVGQSKLDASCSGTTSCDTTGTGLRLFGGYGLGGGWAIELGYADLGDARASVDGIDLKLSATALQVGGAFHMPLSGDWGLALRLGVANVKAKANVVGFGSESDSTTQLYAGVGVTYALSKSSHLELAFDTTRADFLGEKADINSITLGLRFGF
jgi:OmpA-OmpF porin, OOP family